jgi:hypothetical protein
MVMKMLDVLTGNGTETMDTIELVIEDKIIELILAAEQTKMIEDTIIANTRMLGP